jgi:hypothetical protein
MAGTRLLPTRPTISFLGCKSSGIPKLPCGDRRWASHQHLFEPGLPLSVCGREGNRPHINWHKLLGEEGGHSKVPYNSTAETHTHTHTHTHTLQITDNGTKKKENSDFAAQTRGPIGTTPGNRCLSSSCTLMWSRNRRRSGWAGLVNLCKSLPNGSTKNLLV